MYANYDPIARYYDGLSRIVFGNSIRRSQQFLVKAILPGSNILIVGGGTGWILEEISSLHEQGLNITYVEQSAKMMELSKRRNPGLNKVAFQCQPIQTAYLKGSYDVVMVPFLFDNFYSQTIDYIFRKIEAHLKPEVLWLYADFISEKAKPWTGLMIKMMYNFFTPLCHLETSTMPDTRACFQNHDYQVIREASFYAGFIQSVIYQKVKSHS